MDKLRDELTKRIQNLGDSFTSAEEDAMMDDMAEYIVNPYTGSKSLESEKIVKKNLHSSVPSSSKQEDDIIDNIDSAYFIEEDATQRFNAIEYELKKHFEEQLYVDDLEMERFKLKGQLQVVSKKISELIMEKSPSYSRQMEDVDVIREDLKELLEDVKIIRKSLAVAKQKSGSALGILANEKKKRLLNRLRETLTVLKALYETEFQLREAVEEGQFPLAIRIAIEAKEAATTFKHFSCVNDLMCKLLGTTKLIEQAMDESLSTLTLNFDSDKYSCVQQAYAMLKQQEPASRKLVAHFHTSLERSVRTVVSDKVIMDTADASFESICQALPSESAVIAVRETCFILTRILVTYHNVLRFHTEEFERLQSTNSDSPPCAILSYLSASCYTIFRTALGALNILLSSLDFPLLKFDEIMDIVDLINRFCSFGREHFGHLSTKLNEVLKRQTTSYFERYHQDRLFELRMFLENESFTLCPVPHQFTIFDLQDFHFLKSLRDHSNSAPLLESPGDQLDFQLILPDFVNPFGKEELKSRRQSERSDRKSVDDEIGPEDPEDHIPPNLCNTALNILRFFGRYLRMTSLLPSISKESIPGIIQLFEFFFISICYLFGEDGAPNMEKNAPLDQLLQSLQNSLITDALSLPSLCCAVNLTFADQLYGAAERIMALESLEFVARQLDLVRPVIEGILYVPEPVLDEFYSQVLPLVPRARTRILDSIASRALKLDVLHQKIASEKWDIDELRSTHSGYVDFLLQDMEGLLLRIEAVAEQVHVSDSTRKTFFDRVIFYTFKTIVQGYCDSGKCSTEGRALMQLDLQHLTLKLEQQLHIKPVPHTDYVEGYIKAFYLPESGLEQWINQHTEYTSKQMISLLSAANHVSKKAKTRIINALSSD